MKPRTIQIAKGTPSAPRVIEGEAAEPVANAA